MPYLITIYCLLFLWLCWKHSDWSIYLIIATLPSYLIRFSVLGVPLTLLEIMLICLIGVLTLKNARVYWSKLHIPPGGIYIWPILAVVISATIAIFISPDLKGALGIWKAYFIEPILFLAVFVSVIKEKKQLQNVFKALGVSILYLSLIAFWQKFSGWNVGSAFLNLDGSVDRVTSVFGYPNAIGLYFGPIIILFTGLLKENGWKILKWLIIILGFTTIILAKSEAAILSVIFIWIIWGLLNKKTRPISGVLAVIILAILVSNTSISEIIGTKLLFQDYSGFVRTLIYQESWEMLKDNWFWGAGLNGYQTAIAPYHLPTFEIFMYPHNIVFNFWSELGLLGLLSFGWLAIVFLGQNFRGWLKNKNVLNVALIFSAVQIMIHGLVDAPYFKNDLSILFWVIIGMGIIINRCHPGLDSGSHK